MVPLMVHENLLSSARKSRVDRSYFHNVVEGLKGLTIADQLDRSIRKHQDYSPMPAYGFMSCIYPA